MTALQLAPVPKEVEAETASALDLHGVCRSRGAVLGPSVSTPDGPASVPEASVLEAAMSLSTLLPTGWRAELGSESITLSWRTG